MELAIVVSSDRFMSPKNDRIAVSFKFLAVGYKYVFRAVGLCFKAGFLWRRM